MTLPTHRPHFYYSATRTGAELPKCLPQTISDDHAAIRHDESRSDRIMLLDLSLSLRRVAPIVGFLPQRRADVRVAHPRPAKVVGKSQKCIVATFSGCTAPPLDRCRLALDQIGLSIRGFLLGDQFAHPLEFRAGGCRKRLSAPSGRVLAAARVGD